MKRWILMLSLFFMPLFGNESLKKAFSEGIKASVEVVQYEKEQAHKDIPDGYCVTVMGKDASLDLWEEIKLESLALFLELSPSLLAPKKGNHTSKRVLCLSITKEKEKAQEVLKKISTHYPKMSQYITKVEVLPSNTMHRIIPGVGEYFGDKRDEIASLRQKMATDKPLSSRIIFLDKKKKIKPLFDNGSTRVLATALKNVLYVEHTIYTRSSK